MLRHQMRRIHCSKLSLEGQDLSRKPISIGQATLYSMSWNPTNPDTFQYTTASNLKNY